MEARLRKCWARKRPAFAGRPLLHKLDQNTLRSRNPYDYDKRTGYLRKGSRSTNFLITGLLDRGRITQINPMKQSFSTALAFVVASFTGFAQCEADHVVQASSFMYSPNELTIEQGESNGQ